MAREYTGMALMHVRVVIQWIAGAQICRIPERVRTPVPSPLPKSAQSLRKAGSGGGLGGVFRINGPATRGIPGMRASRRRIATVTPHFIHLRLHSEYSIQDGIVRLDDAVARAAEDGMPALALTDLSNVFGLVKFY